MMTMGSSDINEEYIILIGGVNEDYIGQQNVFKFNGTWFSFGKLNKPRWDHSSIYWNGAVYVIGGRHDWDDSGAKMEIWKIKDSPNEFQTTVDQLNSEVKGNLKMISELELSKASKHNRVLSINHSLTASRPPHLAATHCGSCPCTFWSHDG